MSPRFTGALRNVHLQTRSIKSLWMVNIYPTSSYTPPRVARYACSRSPRNDDPAAHECRYRISLELVESQRPKQGFATICAYLAVPSDMQDEPSIEPQLSEVRTELSNSGMQSTWYWGDDEKTVGDEGDQENTLQGEYRRSSSLRIWGLRRPSR